MNHYEQLGVKPDATQPEIKRAYRAKATETHPDKGGNAEDFAPVAKAYEVLSDPDRRLLYDSTGQDRRTPIEIEVQQNLLNLFNEALNSPGDIEVVAFIRDRVKLAGQRVVQETKQLKERQKKLKAKRGKIKSKAATNLAHMVIDGELRNIEAGLAQLDHQTRLQRAMLKELDSYSEDWQPPQPTIVTGSTYFVFSPQV